jgi:uncharacterized protein (UPF0305 family)
MRIESYQKAVRKALENPRIQEFIDALATDTEEFENREQVEGYVVEVLDYMANILKDRLAEHRIRTATEEARDQLVMRLERAVEELDPDRYQYRYGY